MWERTARAADGDNEVVWLAVWVTVLVAVWLAVWVATNYLSLAKASKEATKSRGQDSSNLHSLSFSEAFPQENQSSLGKTGT